MPGKTLMRAPLSGFDSTSSSTTIQELPRPLPEFMAASGQLRNGDVRAEATGGPRGRTEGKGEFVSLPMEQSPLLPGDVVQIRSREEILDTLDSEGQLDGLPFMPEMLRFCGQIATVYRRADKTCDTVAFSGLRKMYDTVHLADLRCDGSSHGGCQAGCLIFWKEAWLRRLAPAEASLSVLIGVGRTIAAALALRSDPSVRPPASGRAMAPAGKRDPRPDPAMTQTHLLEHVLRSAGGPDRYVCQATALPSATSALAWWNPFQYVRDVAIGNVSPFNLYVGLVKWFVATAQLRWVNGSSIPFVKGRLRRTPRRTLELQPGEQVRVKPIQDIQATLDTRNRNRGLSFDSEMLKYCGREYRVLRRVDRIIDEPTGQLIALPGDCVILDDVTCTGEYHRFCPRSVYPYWREIWLERVEPRDQDRTQKALRAAAARDASQA